MDISLGSLFNIYVLSTGRRLFAVQQVKKRAAERGCAAIEQRCALCLEHDRTTRGLESRWLAQQNAAPLLEASATKRVDVLTDRALTSLRDGAEAQLAAAVPGDGLAEKVAAFLLDLFPGGVAKVTSLPYVDELAAVDGIVEKLQGSLAPVAAELGLTRIADRLAQLAVEYRDALEADKPTAIDFGDVRAARARGQDLMLQVVAMIAGTYPDSTPEDTAARAALLAPILEQNEAVRLYLRSRRAVEDVDPETGDVDPNAPTSGPEAGSASPQ